MSEPAIHHLNNRPLRERITELLRDAIISGEMRPGQPLIETELAAQIGVSRAPLREALQVLVQDGLVEMTPYRGTVVRKLTRTDIEELYSFRSVLEQFAIRRILQNGEQVADAEVLRAIYAAMFSAADAGDLRTINVLDRDFHDTLIDLSRHGLLHQSWRSVSLRVRQVMANRNRYNSDLRQIANNHLPIIEAIAAGDEATALLLMERHIASAGDLLVGLWETETEEPL
ncbi:MAG TPA: GntR family transcriptional regulator [Candidatus Limnocylindrales bacterium]|nr:GntR family transcriptional regulator [Candidatus Limnocylindrales bacterium]